MPSRNKKPMPKSRGLTAAETCAETAPQAIVELGQAISVAGGSVLTSYRDPLGASSLTLAVLPVDAIEPTPFQRGLSKTHASKLERALTKLDLFLDPIIVVQHGQRFWTPNGMHRLSAMKALGARSITALVSVDPDLAFQILALNTEKAHNLKDKSLEVVRMADALADRGDGSSAESRWAFEFDEPEYLTMGRCYQKEARYPGSAYRQVVNRCEAFMDKPLAECAAIRNARADKLLALDARVDECVHALQQAGFPQGYLKPVVVDRINPIRSSKQEDLDFDEIIDTMIANAQAFDAGTINAQDFATAGYGGP